MPDWHDDDDLTAHSTTTTNSNSNSNSKTNTKTKAQAQHPPSAHRPPRALNLKPQPMTPDGVEMYLNGDSTDATSQPKQPTKKRKSSSVVRKEEKAGLLEEIHDLETRLAFLNGEVFAPLCASDQVDPQVSNSLLRETVREQELRFAGARSILAQVACSRTTPPTQDYLHLGVDMAARRRQLLELRPKVLDYAYRFISARFQHMDLRRPYSAEERFVTSSGENVVEYWDAHQVPRAQNVAQVYAAVCGFFQQSSRTAPLQGMEEHEFVQRKFVMELERGVSVEHNYVRFGVLEQDKSKKTPEEYALWACCPVSQDDLMPYSPNERYRRDLTIILLAVQRHDMVVLARYSHFRLFHARHITASQDVLEQVMIQWNKFLHGWIAYIQEHARGEEGRAARQGQAEDDSDDTAMHDA